MANFSTEEKANLLIKKFFNKASTNNATPYFQENPIYNARGTVFNDQIVVFNDTITVLTVNSSFLKIKSTFLAF